jgi:SAM-dependent methyltransferase
MASLDETSLKDYGNVINPYLIDMIPKGAHKILDVGCAQGALLEYFKKEGHANETVGIELMHRSAERAKDKVDTVICGNVEQMDLSKYTRHFDYIVYGDVIEHLREPWRVVKRHKALLGEHGRMIFCIPNIRNFFIMTNLIRGFWNYTQYGILDNTHLRFFTLRGIKENFDELELVVEKSFGITPPAAWYKETNENVDVDEQLLKLFDVIRTKYQQGQDCSKELALVFGGFRFNAADISELITAQFVFSVSRKHETV